jgi:hypothetical protein
MMGRLEVQPKQKRPASRRIEPITRGDRDSSGSTFPSCGFKTAELLYSRIGWQRPAGEEDADEDAISREQGETEGTVRSSATL